MAEDFFALVGDFVGVAFFALLADFFAFVGVFEEEGGVEGVLLVDLLLEEGVSVFFFFGVVFSSTISASGLM